MTKVKEGQEVLAQQENYKLRIPLGELVDTVENNNLLILGCPLGVGFSTTILNYISYKIMFEDNYYVDYFTNSNVDLLNAKDIISKNLDFFSIEYEWLTKGEQGIAYIEIGNKNKSSITLISARQYSFEEIFEFESEESGKIDLFVLDRDIVQKEARNYYPRLKEISDKVIISTIDTPKSIFYENSDYVKKVLYSAHSRNKILEYKLSENKSTDLLYEQKLYGKFT